MTCTFNERLYAYSDLELGSEILAEVEAHLRSCEECRAELHALRERKERVRSALSALEPETHAAIEADAAYRRFLQSNNPWPARLRRRIKERWDMIPSGKFTGPLRTGAFAAAAAVLIGILLVVPATRGALADFLGVFRVRQFSAVTVDGEQVDRLKTLAQGLRGVIAEPVMERNPGQPRQVADVAEASSAAGFQVQVPAELPPGAERVDFTVASGPLLRLDFDRELIEQQIEAMGLTDLELPPMESGTIRIDVPNVVHQGYRIVAADTTSIDFVQAHSPSVTFPPGTDEREVGKAFLRLVGMPEDQAERISREIDWTSTLVLPVPRGVGSFQEVDVRGAKGLLLTARPEGEEPRSTRTLLWQRDEILYSIQANRITSSEMLRLAESVR